VRIREALLAWLCLLMPRAAMAQEPLFNAPALTDDELAEARGGFMFGSDVKVDFGAVVTTSVDGMRVLQSQLRINDAGVSASVIAIPGVDISINGVPAVAGNLAAGADGEVAVSIGAGAAPAAANAGEDFLRASFGLPDLAVQQVLGRAISSVIVNTGDNRIIDNHIAINLQLDNVQPLALGSIAFQVQAMGMDAALLRSR
jgi:hypothetical protein